MVAVVEEGPGRPRLRWSRGARGEEVRGGDRERVGVAIGEAKDNDRPVPQAWGLATSGRISGVVRGDGVRKDGGPTIRSGRAEGSPGPSPTEATQVSQG